MKAYAVFGLIILIAACSQIAEKSSSQAVQESNNKESGNGEPESYGAVLAGTTTKYSEFTKAEYDKALADGKTVLLYFFADWCPVCQHEQQDTKAAFAELQDPNIVGFRVHYKDSGVDQDMKDLVTKYGITYQHTKVIIKGNEIRKSLESWDKERYLQELA